MILDSNLIYSQESVIKIDNKISLEEKNIVVATDSRTPSQNEIFIAIKGERLDAFDFIDEQLCSSVLGVVYTELSERKNKIELLASKYPNTTFIGVSDSTLYFQQLASTNLEYWQRQMNGKVFTVTGSNGKTTNKDMLFHILNTLYPNEVHSTWKNFNNHIGVPLTLVSLEKNHRFLVLEIGTNHPGEIRTLCDIAKPSIGYITNIGDSHLEFFKTRDNVFKEKMELFESCRVNNRDGDLFLINADDDLLKGIQVESFCKSCGSDNRCDYQTTIFNDHFKLTVGDESYEVRSELLLGKHNYKNLSMAVALLDSFFKNKRDEILQAAKTFLPQNNRSQIIKEEGQTYFLDAYNANPTSMEVSLSSFLEFITDKQYGHNSLFVLGDMNELGEHANQAHKKLGQFVAEKLLPFKVQIVFIGRYYNEFLQGNNLLEQSDAVRTFKTLESYQKSWSKERSKYSYLFLKASRSLHLESLIGIR